MPSTSKKEVSTEKLAHDIHACQWKEKIDAFSQLGCIYTIHKQKEREGPWTGVHFKIWSMCLLLR